MTVYETLEEAELWTRIRYILYFVTFEQCLRANLYSISKSDSEGSSAGSNRAGFRLYIYKKIPTLKESYEHL